MVPLKFVEFVVYSLHLFMFFGEEIYFNLSVNNTEIKEFNHVFDSDNSEKTVMARII